MMKIIFCTSNSISSRLIRWVTWSDWSHVAIVDGEEVIEAVWPKVRVTPLADVISAHSQCVMVEIPCDDKASIEFARAQVGKPYDLKGMLGLGFHRDWQNDSNWWCSELVAAALQAAGAPLFRGKELHRITPQHEWMLNFPLIDY